MFCLLTNCCFVQLLLSSDLLALKALESVCKDSVRRELAATLVRIFRRENQAIQLLRTVASQEVEREGTAVSQLVET